MTTQDRITVGLTVRGAENLAQVMETGWFNRDLDAYRAAIGVAIAQGRVSEPEEMAGASTKYNVGTLDNDGKLRQLLLAFVPAARERPYEYAERLADAGLAYLVARLVQEGALLSEVLGGTAETTREVTAGPGKA
jgi:hypothetical protein